MLTVAVVLLLLHALLFKAKPGVLYCGLFGGSFNQQIAGKIIHRLKTLGLFNQQRGSDSCGIYNGDELIKGVDGNKKFYDFVVNVGVHPNKGKNNTFIGHTRWATMGVHNEANAHPYNIDNKLIFAHNGKIENAWALCRENDIDTLPLHVDSQGLGHLLAKVGVKILGEYKGFAAILAHDLSKPGTLYAYHGASKKWRTDDKPEEERPLFFMKTPEGVYFSSLKEALLFIKEDDDDEPDVVPHNILFTFKDGKVIKQSKKIEREEKNIYEAPKTVYSNHTPTTSRDTRSWYSGMGNSDSKEDDKYLDILLENIPNEFGDPDRIYYYRNRYWIGTEKCDGTVTVNEQGVLIKNGDTSSKKTTMYFYKGIYLKGDKEYKFIHKQLQYPESEILKTISYDNRNFAKVMSKYSKYPITNIENESKDVTEEYRRKYYMNEKEVSAESIRPVFSERTYTYKDGRLRTVMAIGGKPASDFFLKPAAAFQSGGEGEGTGKGTPKGIAGAWKNNEKSTSEKDEKRREFVADLCHRLRLDKITPNLEKTIALFYTKYSTIEEINTAMTGVGDAVMKLYAIDIMQSYCGMEKPRDSIIYDAIQENYNQAIVEGVPLAELMEEGVEDPEYYIGEVLENWDFDDKGDGGDDVIEVKAEIVEDVEDMSYDPSAPVVRPPYSKLPIQTDFFKDLTHKKKV